METNPKECAHNPADAAFTPLFGGTKIVLSETPKAVTPFGGLSSFVAFLEQIGFGARVMTEMPFPAPTSPNAIPLAHTFTAFIFAVVTGASRFAHTDWLRGDRALHAILGIKRFPGDDTVRGFFRRFTQRHIEEFWRPLWAWLLTLVVIPKEGVHLDLDSTIFCREGKQEGARKGYNPKRKGRPSHHPLVAVLAEVQFVLHGWLRSGNCSSAGGVVAFLTEALALAPAALKIVCVRADSGFFADELLTFLELKQLSYIVVARLTGAVKRNCAGLWRPPWRALWAPCWPKGGWYFPRRCGCWSSMPWRVPWQSMVKARRKTRPESAGFRCRPLRARSRALSIYSRMVPATIGWIPAIRARSFASGVKRLKS